MHRIFFIMNPTVRSHSATLIHFNHGFILMNHTSAVLHNLLCVFYIFHARRFLCVNDVVWFQLVAHCFFISSEFLGWENHSCSTRAVLSEEIFACCAQVCSGRRYFRTCDVMLTVQVRLKPLSPFLTLQCEGMLSSIQMPSFQKTSQILQA